MAPITLTTDYGTHDAYAAQLTGALLTALPGARVIDVSHTVPAYDIVRAAFLVQQAYAYFPAGTLHIISVNDYYRADFRHVVLAHAGHFFLAPDNGLLPLLFPATVPLAAYALYHPADTTLPHFYARTAAHVVAGKPLKAIGVPVTDLMQRTTFQPVVTGQEIRGAIIHVDQYGNAVTNVARPLFEQHVGTQRFELYFKRRNPITQLSRFYQDVAVGQQLCLFNGADLLEVAIAQGNAAELLGLSVGDGVILSVSHL